MEKYINPYTDTKHLWDIANGMDAAEKKGIAKGKAEGEKSKAIDMARLMKADGEPLEKIARYTGLTIDEIKNI